MFKKHRSLTLAGSLLFTALVVLFSAQIRSSRSLASQAGPTANFQWSMPERFGPLDDDGLVDYHWDGETETYAQDYVNPNSWPVNFNACASSGGSSTISSFALEIGGQLIPKGGLCAFSHEFPTLGTYPVKLVVTTSDGQSASAQMDVAVKDLLIVSIGDSFASGEGNPDIPRKGTRAPQWEDEPCHRSANAGPAQAALSIEKADPQTSVTFISFACTGALVSYGVLDTFKGHQPQLTKVTEAVKGRKIDALLISGGGNDVSFSALVKKAIILKDCSQDPETNQLLSDGLNNLPGRYEELSKRLGQMPEVSKVFITEYPDIVHDADGDFCDHRPVGDLVRGISYDEAEWASGKVIAPLNDLVKAAADKWGWFYVGDIASHFHTHGYCAEEQRWALTFGDSLKAQASLSRIKRAYLGTAHPNKGGHAWYATRLIEEMQKRGVTNPPSP